MDEKMEVTKGDIPLLYSPKALEELVSNYSSKSDIDKEIASADANQLQIIYQSTFFAINSYSPSWTPNGKQIVFNKAACEGDALCVINYDGTGLSTLVGYTNGQYLITPKLAPNKAKIAFAFYDKKQGGIAIFDLEKKEAIQLTKDANDEHPAWSPGGQKIVFSRRSNGAVFSPGFIYDLYIMDQDGKNLEQITNGSNNSVSYYAPCWSPDGTKIAFDNQNGIFVMDVNGTNVKYLIKDRKKDIFQPAWSPDGTKLTFIKESVYPATDMCIIDADGNGFTKLISGMYSTPAWSPDNTKITFIYAADYVGVIGLGVKK